MNMPESAWKVIQEMHGKFAAPLPATEDGARTFTRMCIEQLRFLEPAGGWCWKAASATRPPSKDCVARRRGTAFEGWDVLLAAGVNGPRELATYPPTYHDLVAEGNQHPIEVTAINHLGMKPNDDEQHGGGDDSNDDKQHGDWDADMLMLIDTFQSIATSLETIASALVILADTATVAQKSGVPMRLVR